MGQRGGGVTSQIRLRFLEQRGGWIEVEECNKGTTLTTGISPYIHMDTSNFIGSVDIIYRC